MKAELQEIASQFALEGAITAIDSLGEGFINDTFIVRTAGDAPDYILQRKNKSIFPDVPAMMENIRKVTDHIRRRVAAAARPSQPYHCRLRRLTAAPSSPEYPGATPM